MLTATKLATILSGANPVLELTATTTAAGQTVTLQRITPSGRDVTVFWGDGSTSTIADGNTGATTHQYASAGAYNIRISNPEALTYLDLRDSKLRIDSATLRGCGAGLQTLYLGGLGAGNVFRSADIAHLSLTASLTLYFQQPGTYAIDSADFAGYALTNQLVLSFPQPGTYTVARADWDNFPALPTIRVEMNLSQAQVDAILLGLWDGLATRAASGGTIDLAGGGNAAPSGIYQAACPPTTGKEAAYELLNDTCLVNPAKVWSTITVEGGLP